MYMHHYRYLCLSHDLRFTFDSAGLGDGYWSELRPESRSVVHWTEICVDDEDEDEVRVI